MEPADIYCQWIDSCFEHNKKLDKKVQLKECSEAEEEPNSEDEILAKVKAKKQAIELKKIKRN